MNEEIENYNKDVADQLTDGYYNSFEIKYQIKGDDTIISWGNGLFVGATIMHMSTLSFKENIIKSTIKREFDKISQEDYLASLKNIFQQLHLSDES